MHQTITVLSHFDLIPASVNLFQLLHYAHDFLLVVIFFVILFFRDLSIYFGRVIESRMLDFALINHEYNILL